MTSASVNYLLGTHNSFFIYIFPLKLHICYNKVTTNNLSKEISISLISILISTLISIININININVLNVTQANYSEKNKYENLFCNEYFWEASPMWILNIYIPNHWKWGTNLYFEKIILKINKTPRHCKYFCFFYKNFMPKQRIPTFSKQSPLLVQLLLSGKNISSPPLLPYQRKSIHPFINGVGSNYVHIIYKMLYHIMIVLMFLKVLMWIR